MSGFEAHKGERSADKRAGYFAILLLNILVATVYLFGDGAEPDFILTTQDGKTIRADYLASSKVSFDNDLKGFDVRTHDGIARISYDLRGVRKMEILSLEITNPAPTPIAPVWKLPPPVNTNQALIGTGDRALKRVGVLSDEFKVKVKIESYFGEVIEGVSDIKGSLFESQGSFPQSFSVWTDKRNIRLNTRDIRSIERAPSPIYEWSKRLF